MKNATQTRQKPTQMGHTWTDERGIIRGFCSCGMECSTHDDAAFTLDYCGTCGAVTCQDCREHKQHSPARKRHSREDQ